jgi:fructose-1,6-bisphosphatase/inositol monophosphatase family enzyme
MSLHPIIPVVDEAAVLAMSYFRRSNLREERKVDGSLVTEADTAVDELLVPALMSEFPMAEVISEERCPVVGETKRYSILIDPIDGTSAYASGVPGFCISIGVLEYGRPVAGLVAAPAWGATWMCDFDPDTPLLRNGRPLQRASSFTHFDHRTTALVDSKMHRNWTITGFPGRCRSFGSTALHLCLVADSPLFSVAHTGRVHPWDLAGAHAILERAGLTICKVDGAPIDYAAFLPNGIVSSDVLAGHEQHIAAFRSCLSSRL